MKEKRGVKMLKSPYKHPSVYPEEGHPRLMFRQNDIERIKNNFTLPENQRAYEMWQRLLNTNLTQFYDEINNGGYASLVYLYIEAKAFECLIYEKENAAVELIKFTIQVTERASRTGVNPSTKEIMTIEAKNVVKFKAGAELSDKVNL